MVVLGVALLTGALMLSALLGGQYLVELDRRNNEVPVGELQGIKVLGQNPIVQAATSKVYKKLLLNGKLG